MVTSTNTFTPALTPSSGPCARLHVTKRDGCVVVSNVLADGSVDPTYPTPADSVATLAESDDPSTCALLQECARQVFRSGPLEKLGEWCNHLLCAEVGPREGGGATTAGTKSAAVDMDRLKTLHLTNRRGVCGYTFKNGDLCWNCRSCQTDSTCVQCDTCFRGSNHAGHDVYFHHASPGGCCDCGDLEAWDRVGCCAQHSGADPGRDPIENLPASMRRPARVVIGEAVRLVTEACLHAVQGYNCSDRHGFLVLADGAAAPTLAAGGATGDEGHCLVLLHNDDVHTYNQVTDALLGLRFNASAAQILTERVDSQGHAVIKRGTARELEPMLDFLAARGLLVSLVDEFQMDRGERAARLLVWLTRLSTQVDGLARIVAELLAEACPLGLSQLSYKEGTRWGTPWVRIYQPAPDDASLALSTEDASLNLSEGRSSSRLALLMMSDFFLIKNLRVELHALYLHLLVDAHFKPALAKALTWCYPALNSLYSRGVGTHEDNLFSFSVQLYTTPSIVRWLVTSTEDEEELGSRGLLRVLVEAVRQAFKIAGWREGHPLPETFWGHLVLQHRRYAHLLRDIDYALQTEGTAAAMLRQEYPGPGPDPLPLWVSVLGALQHVDGTMRKTGAHMEFESIVWTQAFTLSFPLYSTSATLISYGLRLPSLAQSTPSFSSFTYFSPSLAVEGVSGEEIERKARLKGYRALIKQGMEGLMGWLKKEEDRARLGDHRNASILFDRVPLQVYREMGTGLVMRRTCVYFKLHSGLVSFHLPLHRFLAAVVLEGSSQGLPFPSYLVEVKGGREELRESKAEMRKAWDRLAVDLAASGNHGASVQGQKEEQIRDDDDLLVVGLADFPLRCLALNAQVSAGLWRRNGLAMQASGMHYSSPPFCRAFRDMDLAAVQLAVVLGGNEVVLGLLLDRFCLSEWAGVPIGEEWKKVVPFEEKDMVVLAEEGFLLLIQLVTELPRPPGVGHREAVLRREMVHRLACRKGLTHSEVQQVNALMDRTGREGMEDEEEERGDESYNRGVAFDRILECVSTRKTGTDGAARFDLRPECAWEYDPTFYHISRQEHEAALERIVGMRKQAAPAALSLTAGEGELRPCVGFLPVAHPDFTCVRLLLFWPEVVGFQYTVLQAAARETVEPEGSRNNSTHIHLAAPRTKRSPLLLVRCLHLLTLQLHVYEEALGWEEEQEKEHQEEKGMEKKKLRAYRERKDRPVRGFWEALTRRRCKTNGLMLPWKEGGEGAAAVGAARRSSGVSNGGFDDGVGADELPMEEKHSTAGASSSALDCESMQMEDVGEKVVKDVENWQDGPSILELLVTLAQDSGSMNSINSGSGCCSKDNGLNIGPLYEEGLLWIFRELHDKHLGRFPADAKAEFEVLLRSLGKRSAPATAAMTTATAAVAAQGGVGKGKRGESGSKGDNARRAQAKAMKFFQQQQIKFLEEQASGERGEEEEEEAGAMAVMGREKEETSLEKGAPACLYCHERTGAALAHIGFAQRSNALGQAIVDAPAQEGLRQRYRVASFEVLVREDKGMDSAEVGKLKRGTMIVVEEKQGPRMRISFPVRGWVSEFTLERLRLCESVATKYCFQQWGKTRLMVTTCGHVCHQDCWDSFYASVLQELFSEERFDGRHAIDVNRREFLCPLCKSLSNILIPHIPPHLRPYAEENENVEGIAEWKEGEMSQQKEAVGGAWLSGLAQWALRKVCDGERDSGSSGSCCLKHALSTSSSSLTSFSPSSSPSSSPLLSPTSSRGNPSGLPDVLIRNVSRFADSLGEVLEVSWAKLGLEGEEEGRGSLGSGPKKLVKALHVGWSTAAYSLLLEVVNVNAAARARAAAAGGREGKGRDRSMSVNVGEGGLKKNEEEHQKHLHQLLVAVGSLTALSNENQFLETMVLQPMARLFAAEELVSFDQMVYIQSALHEGPYPLLRGKSDLNNPSRLTQRRVAAMREVPLSLLLDHEIVFKQGTPPPLDREQVTFVDRLRTLHKHRRAAGEPGLVEAWPFWERPLLAHDLNTLAVGTVMLTTSFSKSKNMRADVMRYVQLLALARLAQALLEPGCVRVSNGKKKEKEEGGREGGMEEGADGKGRGVYKRGSGALIRLWGVLHRKSQEGLELREEIIMSRWRPFLQLLLLLVTTLKLTPRSSSNSSSGVGGSSLVQATETVTELLAQLRLSDAFMHEGETLGSQGDFGGVKSLFEKWGGQYCRFVLLSPNGMMQTTQPKDEERIKRMVAEAGESVEAAVLASIVAARICVTSDSTPLETTTAMDGRSTYTASSATAASTPPHTTTTHPPPPLPPPTSSSSSFSASSTLQGAAVAAEDLALPVSFSSTSSLIPVLVTPQVPERTQEEEGEREERRGGEEEEEGVDIESGDELVSESEGQFDEEEEAEEEEEEEEREEEKEEHPLAQILSPHLQQQQMQHQRLQQALRPPQYFSTPFLSVLDGLMAGHDGVTYHGVPVNESGRSLPLYDLSHFGMTDDLVLRLVNLPPHYTQLYGIVKQHTRPTTVSGTGSLAADTAAASGPPRPPAGGSTAVSAALRRDIEDPAICLICGEIVPAGPNVPGRTRFGAPGGCTLHARACGAGSGMMLLVNKGTVLLFRDDRATFYPSPYLDQYGEEDVNLRRGRPLMLSEGRFEGLLSLYREHAVGRTVASRRLNAERVIREGYY